MSVIPLVVAPNLKRRLSGVTATVVRLIPVQAKMIAIRATGPGLPPDVPHIPLLRAATLPRDRWRVWHARRNTLRQDGLARTSSNLSQMEALATSLRVTTGRRPRTAQTPRYGRRQWPGRSSGSLPCPGGR